MATTGDWGKEGFERGVFMRFPKTVSDGANAECLTASKQHRTSVSNRSKASTSEGKRCWRGREDQSTALNVWRLVKFFLIGEVLTLVLTSSYGKNWDLREYGYG